MENTYVLIKKPEWDILLPALKHVKILAPMCTEIHIDKTIKERATEAASKYKWNDERDGKFYIECFIEGAIKQSVNNYFRMEDFADFIDAGCWIKGANGLWYQKSDGNVDEGIPFSELMFKYKEQYINKPYNGKDI